MFEKDLIISLVLNHIKPQHIDDNILYFDWLSNDGLTPFTCDAFDYLDAYSRLINLYPIGTTTEEILSALNGDCEDVNLANWMREALPCWLADIYQKLTGYE